MEQKNEGAMENNLDEYQKEAVECDRNAVVSAGAGSGKTRVLAERYFRLIASGRAKVDSILTLTFTRKAAAEMHRRIYGLLRSRSGDPRIRAEAERFDRACISTLDSFSAGIVRNWSYRYGIAPTFSLEDDVSSPQSERTALSFLLDKQDHPALRYLVRANGFGRVLQGFKNLAAGYLTAGGEKDFPALHGRQMRFLEDKLIETGKKLEAVRRDLLAVEVSPGKTGKQAGSVREGQTVLEGMGDLSVLVRLEDRAEVMGAASVLEKFPKPGGKVSDPDILLYKELIDRLRHLSAPIASLIGTLEQRPLLQGLFSLLEDFEARVNREKRSAGVLTFGDCADLAVRVLTENTALRAYYKRKFRAVMIDEFQDNNLGQKNLLYLIAEREDRLSDGVPAPEDLDPGKLFFVGDEKQSIYRFRGADVRVFKGLSAELARCGGVSIHLKKNYRSEPGLIEFFNTLFARVMKEGEPAPYEAEFAPLEHRDAVLPGKPFIGIFCKPYVKEKEDGLAENDDAEAYHIAKRIKEWVTGRGLPVSGPGGPRPAEYGDIALLMRSTSNQIRFEKIFRLFDIPYTTGSIRSLFLEAPVNDLYNILQCAVYPEDRLAYAALLRSPFVNLSDDTMIELLLLDRPPFDSEEPPFPMAAAEAAKYRAGRDLYRAVLDMADRLPVPRVLSWLWFDAGYRYLVLRNPAYHTYLEFYEYLREFALKVPGEPLALFLDRVRINLGNYERIPDLEIQQDAAEGVRILTVHKAKGLEFPVVILANAGNMGRNDGTGSDLFYMSEVHGPSCGLGEKKEKHNYFHTLAKEENEAQSAAELKRLLYVACTRAEDHLVISGCFNDKNRNNPKSLLTVVFKALGLDPDFPRAEDGAVYTLEEIPDIPEEQTRTYGKSWHPVALEEAFSLYSGPVFERRAAETRYTATELQALFGPGPETETAALLGSDSAGGEGVARGLPGTPVEGLLGGGMDAWFGSLCHLVIERRVRALSLRPVPPGLPLQAECPRPEVYGRLHAAAEAFAEGFFSSPFGGEIFGSGTAVIETEVPFTARLGPGPGYVNGIMDLVVLFEDKTWVVDFKTDRTADPGRHGIQLGIYRRAAEAIWGRPAEAFVFYLRSGEAVRVDTGGLQLPASITSMPRS
jgi:ATP-dependent exoDNAse (exonuclease V) beta subunit